MKIFLLIAITLILYVIGCKDDTSTDDENVMARLCISTTFDQVHYYLSHKYPQVPDANAMLAAGDTGMAVYSLCKARYAESLAELKNEADSLGAKMVLVLLTPEVGQSATPSLAKGGPFILASAKKLGIDAYDLTIQMAAYSPKDLTQMPLDGHWSISGAKIVADLYKPILLAINGHHSTKTFTETERPPILGDLNPNQHITLDGGKDIPYQLITNSQGFRMEYAVRFPKTKQRILFLGDSQLYSPFLDNNHIATSLLQQQFADKEIINAGIIGYTLDDFESLLAQKAKYTEPDVIILVTNPNNIGDFYFTHRNRMGRIKKAHLPVSSETALYHQLFSGK